MNANEFTELLKRHDWFYYMSDDHGVYTRGDVESARVFDIAKNGSDELKRAYNLQYAKQFREPDFTNVKVPFPDVNIKSEKD